ncbi:hypothetical protein [Streptomyces adelaidensis]|uniref:hypothetical protein n=1 Tax=Streptomyces adelaidensis TaxID=2796465 RepID=UPI0019058707|nr:hypothetical protein [Streptomyces adelaidensis]
MHQRFFSAAGRPQRTDLPLALLAEAVIGQPVVGDDGMFGVGFSSASAIRETLPSGAGIACQRLLPGCADDLN